MFKNHKLLIYELTFANLVPCLRYTVAELAVRMCTKLIYILRVYL
jgi:hypothetical protein